MSDEDVILKQELIEMQQLRQLNYSQLLTNTQRNVI